MKIKEKSKNQRGESITEALVATLVVALGSILFASAVAAASRMLIRTEAQFQAYYAADSVLEGRSGSSIDGYTLKVSNGTEAIISQKGNTAAIDVPITIYENQSQGQTGTVPVVRAYILK